jgi:hypothetical protein
MVVTDTFIWAPAAFANQIVRSVVFPVMLELMSLDRQYLGLASVGVVFVPLQTMSVLKMHVCCAW